MYNWSVIHGIKRKPHLSVVWNWYHFVAIAILHQPRPTDSADINTRLQLSDTSSIPPMHGGFLLWWWRRWRRSAYICMQQKWPSCQKKSAEVGMLWCVFIMTSSNGSISRIVDPSWGESTGHSWIPITKASDAELWCVLWSAHEQTVEQTIETPVIWDAIALIMAFPMPFHALPSILNVTTPYFRYMGPII